MPPLLRPTTKQIRAATEYIGNLLEPSPLRHEVALDPLVGTQVFVKWECFNPIKSFKIRGALNLVQSLLGRGVTQVLTASTGNHGAAMAFACARADLPLTVGVPLNCDQSKLALIRHYNAKIQLLGQDLDQTKALMLETPLPDTTVFIEDGSCPEIFAGTATIGAEIAAQQPDIETAIIPVGNGALIGGLGTALKNHNPATKIIGVQSELAPCMALSFKAGRAIDTPSCATFASGMAVRIAIPAAVELLSEVVDEMVLVSEENLKAAMGLYYRHTGEVPEGAGAAALAAALKHPTQLRGDKICLLVSGANVDPDLRLQITDV